MNRRYILLQNCDITLNIRVHIWNRRIRHTVITKNIKLYTYQTIIQSILAYGVEVWQTSLFLTKAFSILMQGICCGLYIDILKLSLLQRLLETILLICDVKSFTFHLLRVINK